MPATKTKEQPSTQWKTTGQIEPDRLYSLEEFKRVTGLKDWALRQARRAGLKMLKLGNRKFVKGQAFIVFLENQNETQETDNGSECS
ncbi:hypothetical protein [Gimesia sp.]|uniref:hypothetical protein n=1 Tax=Gimesia sp. TaxID=2024833 RepID=UPI000C4C30FB|nr:hypothetical protein [Gimesia sp.]MAX40837.1 hypothetical protein [Gimesia sp.]HBL45456.1 hypothetical protein [Planctomycetaceae bacterium]